MDTIFALSSGAVPAGIAVIRLSGPEAGMVLERLSGKALPEARHATWVILRDPKSREALDNGLALWFPGPRSVTGEDVVELQIHGGRAVVAGVLEALAGCEGLRPAEAGEFSRRAFDNGKLDLTAVEGLADLIHAETEIQRRQSLRQMRGELGRLYDAWRNRLMRARAHLESTIDFSDEELPESLEKKVRAEATAVLEEIETHLDDHHRGEMLRSGVYIAIIGPPNAGKSSLLNLLSRRDAAIVSETAGTTRDVIEVHLDLGGYPVVMADTAGLRDDGDAVEREGIRRARMRAEDADLKVAVLSAETESGASDRVTATMIDEDTLVVLNKIDLRTEDKVVVVGGQTAFPVSAKTGAGMDRLVAAVETAVSERCAGAGTLSLTRVRHRRGLEVCAEALRVFAGVAEIELAAEHLRIGGRALGAITGAVGVEDLLDVIFQDFCIGK